MASLHTCGTVPVLHPSFNSCSSLFLLREPRCRSISLAMLSGLGASLNFSVVKVSSSSLVTKGEFITGSSWWSVCLLVGCLMSQQHASVSQGRICSDNFTCCHTEIEVADPTFYLTQSQYTDTGLTSPSADRITPGTWQGSHWSANF